jgi:phospholipase/carboxylesterase
MAALSLVHLVQQPRVPSEGAPPILFLLHGVGSNERDLFGLAPYLDPRFLIVSVRARLTLGPDAFGWYPVQFGPTGVTADEGPELFTGVVPMSGRLLPGAWEHRAGDDALRHLAYCVVHGTQDAVLPISQGREIRDSLSQLPVSLTYKEYPMAHQVSERSLSDVTNWLTAHLDGA